MITIETLINAPIEKVWSAWTTPEDIMKWNSASPDWHTPSSTVDLHVGGTFTSRMEARDGSVGFDFAGTYTNVVDMELIEYSMSDGRKVSVKFVPENDKIRVIESFDPENENPEEMQRAGWQSILDNFAKYVENK
jgi:uncharacterized protein YndB with AHSA1/START domain